MREKMASGMVIDESGTKESMKNTETASGGKRQGKGSER